MKITRDDIIGLLIKEGVLKEHDIESFFNLQITRDGYTGTVKHILNIIEHYTGLLNEANERNRKQSAALLRLKKGGSFCKSCDGSASRMNRNGYSEDCLDCNGIGVII